jgi:hypothetical protein
VQVEIAGETHRDALLVPVAAVVQEGEESFVYTVDAGRKAHRVAVRTGIAAGGEVEVRQGVAPGDRVVVEGQNGLPDGATVLPTGSSSGSGR